MTDCCGQPAFCEKPCFHDSGRSTPGRAGAVSGVLEERGKRYGPFIKHANVAQALKKTLFNCVHRGALADDQVEALEMICHKIARIVNGDPNYADSWIDIAGYAQLVADRLEAGE